jgi:hypothetical protein
MTCWIITLLPYILAAWPGSWLISWFLKRVGPTDDKPDAFKTPKPMGMWIGILERWLVIFLAGQGEWSSVGFIVAAKGLLRFPELRRSREQTDSSYLFSSYVLLGTLASILLAGLLARGAQWLCWVCVP